MIPLETFYYQPLIACVHCALLTKTTSCGHLVQSIQLLFLITELGEGGDRKCVYLQTK